MYWHHFNEYYAPVTLSTFTSDLLPCDDHVMCRDAYDAICFHKRTLFFFFPKLSKCCLLSHLSQHYVKAVCPYYSHGYLPLSNLIPNFSKIGTENNNLSPLSDSCYCVQNFFQSGESCYHKTSVSQ